MWPILDINLAMTVDGRVCQEDGSFGNFTSPYDKQHMDKLRSASDGICIGAATLRQDNPPMHIRDQHWLAWRRQHRGTAHLPVLIFTQQGGIDLSWQLWQHGQPVYLCCNPETPLPSPLPPQCKVLYRQSSTHPLAHWLEQLYHLGFRHLLAEGGPTMAAQWLALGAVRYLYVTIAPYLLGGQRPITLLQGTLPHTLPLQLEEIQQVGQELFCKYLVLPQTPSPTKG